MAYVVNLQRRRKAASEQAEIELLRRLDDWQKHFGKPVAPGRANPDNDLFYVLADAEEAIRGLRWYARRLEEALAARAALAPVEAAPDDDEPAERGDGMSATLLAPRRGLRRNDAAAFLGLTPDQFDWTVCQGIIPDGFFIDDVKVWDVRDLDAAMSAVKKARQ